MTWPRRVALGITGLDVGGAERNLVELAIRLDPRERTPSVVCLQPAGPLAARLTDAGVPVESLGMHGVRDVPRALPRWMAKLRAEPVSEPGVGGL